ncbi:ankyrin repeat-containing protein BDA1-like [Telopea speciosissima]|uniref:ankyrin repeat-containing protein BDA1-like n=1 Tax=Telopea speciosissima TaxID=54955 RepID=UPI001CC4A793|nr:ankyrin repeat-containing protein BDA1-like [Telopea speciosissima]
MDPRLMEVAKNGDINAFYSLLGEDPSILEYVEKISFINTPLHYAVSAGNICLVKEIINLKPSYTLKLNQDGFSPLHLASKDGNLEMVKVLLKDESGDDGLCNLRGREKMIPLHCAAIEGHIKVLEELLSSCPNSIKALTVREESVVHLAVKSDEVKTFKALLSWVQKHWHHDILSWKDEEGNTVLHLATSKGQYEIVEVLLHNSLLVRNVVRVNERNADGLTAMDLLLNLPSSSTPNRERIKTMLSEKGAKKAKDINGCQVAAKTTSVLKWVFNSSRIKSVSRYFKMKVEKDTPSDERNALLVIVVLIATATYQTGISPPGGYWDKDGTTNYGGTYYAGQPIWSTVAPITYNLVMLFNFAGFILSLILAYNLTLGFPLRGPLLLALVFMLLTYSWSTPIFYNDYGNGPAGDDYLLGVGNLMLWLPVAIAIIIWAITAKWMEQIWWKLSLLTGHVRY